MFEIQEKKLDRFLEIVYTTQFQNDERSKKLFEFFTPILEDARKRLDDKTYWQYEDMFWECYCKAMSYCSVESMKMAIGIVDRTYLPWV